ncbi:MAG: diaminopimelate epimerase [Betaproteobacteria bacterium]|nr:diaminopimelate epimerase [Betaproteobacteria bacterium]
MIRFTKMQGAGNDFVVIDACRQEVPVNAVDWKQLADRQFGIGADQILIVEKPQNPQHDFRYRIFNADGAEVEQCGNGARCFVRFVHDQGLSTKKKISVETTAGLIVPELTDNGLVRVDMAAPNFGSRHQGFVDWEAARRLGKAEVEGRIERVELASPAPHVLAKLELDLLSMGNPHAVLFLDAPANDAMLAAFGAYVCKHPVFPKGVNVGFASLRSPQQLQLRVFERGAGETLACGSGACAAAVLAMERKRAQSRLQVQAREGNLWIEWAGGQSAVMMSGPAETVFEGQIVLPMRQSLP